MTQIISDADTLVCLNVASLFFLHNNPSCYEQQGLLRRMRYCSNSELVSEDITCVTTVT